MELTGKIIKVLPMQSGAGKNGTWNKQEVVIETSEQYPKKVCIAFWGDKASTVFNIGSVLHVGINIESREYNGRYFTEVKGWKIFSQKDVDTKDTQPTPMGAFDNNGNSSDNSGNLPF